jgi:hypothetical protein
VRGGEFFAERKTHVLQISACSVDENDRWVGAGRVLRKAEQGNMQPAPPDLDKLTSWRMSVLELGHPQPGRSSEKANTQGQDDEQVRHRNDALARLESPAKLTSPSPDLFHWSRRLSSGRSVNSAFT